MADGMGGAIPHTTVSTGAASPERLDALPLGARATVGVPSAVDATVVRLLEMGLTEGAEVALTRRAPGGDPLEIQVRGTRVCLRRADAAKFPVRRVGGTR